MGRDGTTSDRVGAGIERLEDRFGSFPVNQTTLTVPEQDYTAARERARRGCIDVYVRVRDGDGAVLHVDGDDPTVPRCEGSPGEPIALRVREAVRERTGVVCTLEDVVRATIAGVHREDDREAPTVYRLVALVDAAYEGGDADGGVWRSGEPVLPEYV